MPPFENARIHDQQPQDKQDNQPTLVDLIPPQSTNMHSFMPLGEFHIPPLSSGELTAYYKASDWASFAQSWRMTVLG